MWYTVVSRCAVPHVSPLGPLRRTPRETLLVTISERSRALFNTLIRFTIRDSVCTFVIIASDMCTTTRSLCFLHFSFSLPHLNFSITLPALLTVLSALEFFRGQSPRCFQFSQTLYIDIQLFVSGETVSIHVIFSFFGLKGGTSMFVGKGGRGGSAKGIPLG